MAVGTSLLAPTDVPMGEEMPEHVASLLAAAAAAVEAVDAEAALSHYREAVSAAPRCVAAHDGLADVLLSTGDADGAEKHLRKSVKLAPDGNAERYMNLGQLTEGTESLKWIAKGVAILRAELAALAAPPPPASSKKKSKASASAPAPQAALTDATQRLACALCAEADVYLNDACDEDEAETRCEGAASEALELVKGLAAHGEKALAEPFITCASLRISQCRPDEAAELLQGALAVMDATAEEEELPPLDVRKACAQMLMEVGEAGKALEVLHALKAEADDVLELRYLAGCAAYQAGEIELAMEEVEAAIAYASSDICPPQEREWIGPLSELQADVTAAAASAPDAAHDDEQPEPTAAAKPKGKGKLKVKGKAAAVAGKGGAAEGSAADAEPRGAAEGGERPKKKRKKMAA
jgi:tetratricopeptide (TPR) repeat protein